MNLFLILVLFSAQTPPLTGTLCFSEGRECVPTSGTTIDVAEHESQRTYVWTIEDHRTVVIGELAPGAAVIDLGLSVSPDAERVEPEGRRTVKLSVRGDAGRGWPSDVRFMVTESKEKRWAWTLPAGSTRGQVTLLLPAGASRISMGAKRHRSESRQLRTDKKLSLGQVELKPHPAISGRVTRVEEEDVVPVVGAQIMLADGKLAATTNEQGVFRAELSEPVPNEMMVMSPGLATQVVLLERLEAENDLGEIRLASGVKLTLEVDRPDELRSKSVRVKLLRENEKRYEHTLVGTKDLQAGEERKELSNLSSGEYLVMFVGDHELERMVVPIEIGQDDVTRRIEIRPYRLEGSVTFGDEPLTAGTVAIGPARQGPTWKATLPIDAEGGFGGILWQTGLLSGFIKASESLGGLLFAESPELGSDPSIWSISFKKRLIHGRVFDVESGAGIGDIKIQLQTEAGGGGRGYSPVRVGPSGEYEILAWQDGIYDLIVTSKDYLPKTESVVLTDADGSRNVDIGLERGMDVTLQFVWTSGQPIADATILEGVARDGHNPERLHSVDAAGRLTLRVSPGESRLLYVIPRDGSFAPVRVTATSSTAERPMRVEIPPPAGSLRLAVKDADGNAASGFVVVMRYNGEWIPYSTIGRFRGNRTPGGVEYLGMPAGAYEVWALMPGGGGRKPVPNAPPSHAPVRVGLAAGGASAEVTVVELP